MGEGKKREEERDGEEEERKLGKKMGGEERGR